VLPGDFIGTTEEFRAGEQTYERTGGVYAAITGTVRVNTARRLVSVIPCTDTPPVLKRGDIVIGQIVGLRDSLAMVTIAGAKGVVDREIPNVGSAVVHVSNVKRAYVKDISHEFGIFDIVKAKIIDLSNMRLDTSEPEMGVMKALCSKCRTALVRHDSKLKCPECGRIETRKLATGYGTGII
jgi:exosome complex component CSL4